MVNVIQRYPGYFNVRSHSGNGSYPVVNSSPDCTGSWSCECLGYHWRGRCRHIEEVKSDGRPAADDQQLVRQNFAVLADLNGYRKGLTEGQYIALLEAS